MMTKIEQILKNVNGATFISIDTETTVVLAGGKGNEMQGRVTKVQTGSNVMVFQNKTTNAYENMVNRRLQQLNMNPRFEVGPRAWGHRIPNTPFITHNGELYLEVIFLKAGEVSYKLDGEPIKEADIIGLKERSEPGHQGGLGATEKAVIIRTFKVSNVKTITVDGERHIL
jgi:hypothetical protein